MRALFMSAYPHIRHNFWMHCLEGGFYMAGLAFLAPETAMPSFVKSLGGVDGLVALMPVLLPAAFSTPGLFAAPIVERLQRYKPWVVTFGALQRLPYLITALVLFFTPHLGEWLLPIVVLTPIISGLVGGIGVNAWMEMVTRMIPPHQRASGWAIRYMIQGVIGLSAGPVIHYVLGTRPGPQGFAWLHLICFGFLVFSFIAQWRMIETPHPHPLQLPRPSYQNYLRELPLLLRSQPQLVRLVFARFTGMGYLMVVSFLTIHALRVTDSNQADVGHFVLANMIGLLIGNVIAGLIGNRKGGRVVMFFSRGLCLVMCMALPFISSFSGFLAAYFFWGFGLFSDRVGDLTFSAELCPVERRPTYQAILAFCQMIALITATAISGTLFMFTQSFTAVSVLCACFAAVSLLILRCIPEVRGKGVDGSHASPVMGENPPMA